ncbi:MAG: prolipoprotein diacylglyceryl transferase, partial [Thermaurantiacus tibetensis]
MQAAIPFPDISPELFTIPIGSFEFALRWYALAYIAGLLIGWRIIVALVRRPGLWPGDRAPMTPAQVEELLTGVIIGVIVGGRLGHVLFYQPGYYLQHPLEVLFIWQGGMSFHGGFLGVVAAALLFARRHRVPVAQLSDALAVATPVGLLLGRIANFINAEL